MTHHRHSEQSEESIYCHFEVFYLARNLAVMLLDLSQQYQLEMTYSPVISLASKKLRWIVLSYEKSSPFLSEISPYPPLSVKEGERIVAKHYQPPLWCKEGVGRRFFTHPCHSEQREESIFRILFHIILFLLMDISPYGLNMTQRCHWKIKINFTVRYWCTKYQHKYQELGVLGYLILNVVYLQKLTHHT